MSAVLRHWPRILITLLPVVLMLVHVGGTPRRPVLDGLDLFIADWRLRLTLPGRLDPRIVIVDIDDASLQAVGQWPWGRDKLATLTTELMVRQKAAVLGFDMVFPEADRSSGLATLRELAQGPLSDNAALQSQLDKLAPTLDHDGAFARAMQGHRVALGFYLTQGDMPLMRGLLPKPVLPATALPAGLGIYATNWDGYGSNIAPLAKAAKSAGFINAVISSRSDGLLRAAPLLGYYGGTHGENGYYESLGLAVYRLAAGVDSIVPVLVPPSNASTPPVVQALQLGQGANALRVPMSSRTSMLVPFLGPGGPLGGSFLYISAQEILSGELPPGELQGKIVLVGTTAPGLQDLRATPVGATFPGVEVHANVISALLDKRFIALPDYAPGYEFAMLVLVGLVLAVGLSLMPVAQGGLLFLAVLGAVVGLNTWLFKIHGLVLPMASTLVTMVLALVTNMGWGYFVEARKRRSLAELFGTYVPPQLVEKMMEQPERYSMRAESKELTALFCDMRGFTRLSENLAPVELQAFLNRIFSRLSEIISRHGGTVDKYMGDSVMAFWGAPVDNPLHATLAVRAAIEMAKAVEELSADNRATGLPEVSVGIGLNTGLMSVGDMGSAVRRSYTVIGDAVNLAARLESLSGAYGVSVVASESTARAVPNYAWQELDRVRVKGRSKAVTVFTPVALRMELTQDLAQSLATWAQVLAGYRAQQPAQVQPLLDTLLAEDAKKVLYRLYAERLASMASRPFDPEWDGATRFESK
ncbi:MAG: adenylate/guanylate cyclase domain-containing protein [Proteobacteria bacterium]|nr:adenylate/guanylate cyclase domain-containing protein [Pseudomonadota bacterium]